MTFVLFVLGFALLILGAELLVRGSSNLARKMGISPLVIGLTIVAYGTSTPELAVSVISTMKGQADIALGNVVGSNIFNVLFILGISALVAPLVVAQKLVRWDVPFMIGLSFLAYFFGMNGTIGRGEGIFLLAGVLCYTIFVVKQSKQEKNEVKEEYAQEYGAGREEKIINTPKQLALIVGGLLVLVVGTKWFVNGAVAIAQMLGVSELVIGLTIVAAGTSMPEVFTSIIATRRGELDIAVGNVVGSNIFNIMAVLGLSATVSSHGVAVAPSIQAFDMPIMIAVAVACLPIFFTGHKISRWEGAVLFFYYLVYTAFLILKAAQHDAFPYLNAGMLWFVIPLTFVTLAVYAWRHWSLLNKRPRM